MGKKRKPAAGLYVRNGKWFVDKWVRGRRIHGSTGTANSEEAKQVIARVIEEDRQASVYGVRPTRTFSQAAIKYLEDQAEMNARSFERNAQDLRLIVQWVGELPLPQVHAGSLASFIDSRKREGVAAGTINRTLAITRRVLNLSARYWRDENGLTWLQEAPLIPLLPDNNKRQPFPLTPAEQQLLFSKLPSHLFEMAGFAASTGAREQEVCQLRWSWEIKIPELESFVFVIPAHVAKAGRERVLILNSAARAIVDLQRGKHPDRVFTLDGKPLTKIYNSAWKRARRDAAAEYQQVIGEACPEGFENVRVHDLRHTFGRRLRALDVALEDREDLLGHASGRMTTHYSAAEIGQLQRAVERLVDLESHQSPTVTILRAVTIGRDRAKKQPEINKLKYGGDEWNRTTDLSIMSAAL